MTVFISKKCGIKISLKRTHKKALMFVLLKLYTKLMLETEKFRLEIIPINKAHKTG